VLPQVQHCDFDQTALFGIRAKARSQEDLDAYHVIESTPRSVGVNDFTVHARGNDLDDLLGTMERVAPVVAGDPTTDVHSAAALIDGRDKFDNISLANVMDALVPPSPADLSSQEPRDLCCGPVG
jgi:hypothetical protein